MNFAINNSFLEEWKVNHLFCSWWFIQELNCQQIDAFPVRNKSVCLAIVSSFLSPKATQTLKEQFVSFQSVSRIYGVSDPYRLVFGPSWGYYEGPQKLKSGVSNLICLCQYCSYREPLGKLFQTLYRAPILFVHFACFLSIIVK